MGKSKEVLGVGEERDLREREKMRKRERKKWKKEDTRTRWSFLFHLADLSRIAF